MEDRIPIETACMLSCRASRVKGVLCATSKNVISSDLIGRHRTSLVCPESENVNGEKLQPLSLSKSCHRHSKQDVTFGQVGSRSM